MACQRCKNEPVRTNGDKSALRRCAFDERGKFVADNWQCATLDALSDLVHSELAVPGTLPAVLYSLDEVLQIVPCDPEADHGWIAMTRTQHRHVVASAVHVGAHAPKVLSLGVAITTLAYWARRKNAMRRDRLSLAPMEAVTAEAARAQSA